MTDTEFRQNALLRQELAGALEVPAFRMAVQIWTQKFSAQDLPLGAPDNASVRRLSYRCGAEAIIHDLHVYTEPPRVAHEDPPPDWGVAASALIAAGLDPNDYLHQNQ